MRLVFLKKWSQCPQALPWSPGPSLVPQDDVSGSSLIFHMPLLQDVAPVSNNAVEKLDVNVILMTL